MFTEILKNQYIGKSKLTFTKNGEALSNLTLIGEIGKTFADFEGKQISLLDSRLPDCFIQGHFSSDDNSMEVNPSEYINTQRLYITGIPKDALDLEPYRLKGVIWSSYYEDNYRGYLFQMVPMKYRLELKSPNGKPVIVLTNPYI